MLKQREDMLLELHAAAPGGVIETAFREQLTNTDATLSRLVQRAAEYAVCAERLLAVLVFSRAALWHRLRLKVRPSAIERICSDGMKAGEFSTSPLFEPRQRALPYPPVST